MKRKMYEVDYLEGDRIRYSRQFDTLEDAESDIEMMKRMFSPNGDERCSTPKEVEVDSQIGLIAAMDLNGAIGRDLELLFKIQEDIDHFRKTTMNFGKIVMGTKTWKSIGGSPLRGRVNVIMSQKEEVGSRNGSHWIRSFEEIKPPYAIIGGGQIYKKALDEGIPDRLFITKIHAEGYNPNIYLDIPEDKYELIYIGKEQRAKDSGIVYQFLEYRKK